MRYARWPKGGGRRTAGPGFRGLEVCLGLILFLAIVRAAGAAEFKDRFADRELLDGDTGTLEGSNELATREVEEPRHARKAGGHSLWVSWEAPADGLLRLSTTGSSFDTILAAYHQEAGAPANGFSGLEALGSDDDDEDESPEPGGLSKTSFAVHQGQRIEIAIDGYGGAAGKVLLNWTFTRRDRQLPVLGTSTGDLSAREGESVTLAVAVSFREGAEFRWFRNGEEVDHAEQPTLTLDNLRREQAGRYRLRVKADDLVFYSEDIELQINTEGQGAVLARNKLLDAVESRLRPDDQGSALATLPRPGGRARLQAVTSAAPIGVVRGLNGTQIFNTRFATRDPGEPLHCGQGGGASYWFAYECVESGRLHFDTAGSAVDTVLAVYTFDPPLTTYAQLAPVSCDLAQSPARPAAAVDFPAEAGRTYLVAVDGLQGARGLVHLSYQWTRPVVPADPPPGIVEGPVSLDVLAGQSWDLSVVVTGAPPVTLQWWKDGAALAEGTNAHWFGAMATTGDAGSYWLVAANRGGSVTSALAQVRVSVPPPELPPVIQESPKSLHVVMGQAWTLSVVVTGAPPVALQWWKDGVALAGGTNASWSGDAATPSDAGAYSVVAANAGGSVTSAVAQVLMIAPPVITRSPVSQLVAPGGRARFRVELEPGSEDAVVSWTHDGWPLEGRTGLELILDSCGPAMRGSYVAEAVNLAGSARSLAADLEVLTSPRIMVPRGSDQLVLCIPVLPGHDYRMETSRAASMGWSHDQWLTADETGLLVYRHPMDPGGQEFFRCVPVNPSGTPPGAVGR